MENFNRDIEALKNPPKPAEPKFTTVRVPFHPATGYAMAWHDEKFSDEQMETLRKNWHVRQNPQGFLFAVAKGPNAATSENDLAAQANIPANVDMQTYEENRRAAEQGEKLMNERWLAEKVKAMSNRG
jgi:hypothetical protein